MFDGIIGQNTATDAHLPDVAAGVGCEDGDTHLEGAKEARKRAGEQVEKEANLSSVLARSRGKTYLKFWRERSGKCEG